VNHAPEFRGESDDGYGARKKAIYSDMVATHEERRGKKVIAKVSDDLWNAAAIAAIEEIRASAAGPAAGPAAVAAAATVTVTAVAAVATVTALAAVAVVGALVRSGPGICKFREGSDIFRSHDQAKDIL
jgi:hypothetical protein